MTIVKMTIVKIDKACGVNHNYLKSAVRPPAPAPDPALEAEPTGLQQIFSFTRRVKEKIKTGVRGTGPPAGVGGAHGREHADLELPNNNETGRGAAA
jgi:hypothetical protein